MIREEEIINQAVKEQSQLYQSSEWRAGFISGAKWADEHPKEGLVNLKDACEWLELRVSEYFPVDTNECGTPFCESWIKAQEERIKAIKEFITAFRQAMEGGAE